MPYGTHKTVAAHGLGEHAQVLGSFAETTDEQLAPLADAIGTARVIALGEGVHFVAEFGEARRRPARWLRRYNATSGNPVRLIGVHTSVAGGTLAPNLIPLIDYLDTVDPENAGLARTALRIAERRCPWRSGTS